MRPVLSGRLRSGLTLAKLDRTAERSAVRADWPVAETVFDSEECLVEIALRRRILPFIPVIDKGARTGGTLSPSDFTCEEENDCEVCPKARELAHRQRNYPGPGRLAPEMKPRRYRAAKADCLACPLKAQCCQNSETHSLQRGKNGSCATSPESAKRLAPTRRPRGGAGRSRFCNVSLGSTDYG